MYGGLLVRTSRLLSPLLPRATCATDSATFFPSKVSAALLMNASLTKACRAFICVGGGISRATSSRRASRRKKSARGEVLVHVYHTSKSKDPATNLLRKLRVHQAESWRYKRDEVGGTSKNQIRLVRTLPTQNHPIVTSYLRLVDNSSLSKARKSSK
jgi:hypothetical protein